MVVHVEAPAAVEPTVFDPSFYPSNVFVPRLVSVFLTHTIKQDDMMGGTRGEFLNFSPGRFEELNSDKHSWASLRVKIVRPDDQAEFARELYRVIDYSRRYPEEHVFFVDPSDVSTELNFSGQKTVTVIGPNLAESGSPRALRMVLDSDGVTSPRATVVECIPCY